MGRRITIQRPRRLTFVKRPPTSKQKEEEPRVARFYADDVTWAAPGPITATHVLAPDGMRTINPDGTLGPVEEGVAAPVAPGHEHAVAMRGVSTHQHGVPGEGRYIDRQVRNANTFLGRGVSVTNSDPNDTVRVMLRDETIHSGAEEPVQPEAYHYTYSNGLPVWRQHNVTGERDAAHCFDNDMTDRWDIQWTHEGVVTPVHIEHVERSALEDSLGTPVTIAMVHRVMHPGAGLALSYSERQDILDDHFILPQDATDEQLLDAQNDREPPLGPSNEAVAYSVEQVENDPARPPKWTMSPHLHHDKGLLRKKFKAKLAKFRHWQAWEKNKVQAGHAQSWTQRGPLMDRMGAWPIFAVYVLSYAYFVIVPGMELLHLVNQ